ncbi:MAG: purine-nucleoside phosphorylase [Desulfovibrionaceae bacterium]|nr:purine-nucleoside phosphorylase [Desulfovibrionaceae bacterium]
MLERENIQNAVSLIQENLDNVQAGTTGLVLGSGLSGVAECIEDPKSMEYKDIPGLPQGTAPGHQGRLVAGTISGRPVLALCGRFHLYEGLSAARACAGIRVLGGLGVRSLVLTNAAGALNPNFEIGSFMCIIDHINLTGQSPLTALEPDFRGRRFPDMSRAYDPELIRVARAQAKGLGPTLELGVYLQVPGPNLETPAETRAFRALGADAVGMSTAIETIAARHLGMRVLGICCLTNKNLPDCMQEIDEDTTLERAGRASGDLARLLQAVLAGIKA